LIEIVAAGTDIAISVPCRSKIVPRCPSIA
jgi:hypothetical protein